MKKSGIRVVMDDAKDVAINIEDKLNKAGIAGRVMEVSVKKKYNEFVVRVNRSTFLPSAEDWEN